jgi:hypothetical protein
MLEGVSIRSIIIWAVVAGLTTAMALTIDIVFRAPYPETHRNYTRYTSRRKFVMKRSCG